MSNRAKHIALICVCVVCLSLAGALWYFTEPCEQCGKKFCFGSCAVTQGNRPGLDNTGGLAGYEENKRGPTLLAYSGVPNDGYLEDVYFIGDSRTVGLVRAGMPEERLFAETGMCHEDALTKRVAVVDDTVLVTIPDALRIVAPKVAVVNFGINGIGFMSKESFLKEYRAMMEGFIEASPHTVFVIESILPVSASYEASTGVTNEEIDEMNLKLYELAEELGCYYLASDTVMKNEENDLLRGYNDGDGLHYNEKGYAAILAYVKTHVVPEWEEK